MRKYLARITPGFFKRFLRTSEDLLTDLFRRFKSQGMIPPKSMDFAGPGCFEEIGREFQAYFVELGGLRPNDRVLDVGCGIGRMAIPLTRYLSKQGQYWGFDIVKKGIEWCERRISRKFGNFHFQHSDIFNHHFNPEGRLQAREYRFPFQDSYFDFVFLTSVFTHMLPLDMENYLSEISRVLRIGGKCFITFFIWNEESEKLVRSGQTTQDFKHKVNGCFTINEEDPETAIAYPEDFLLGLFKKYRLKILPPIHYGHWCSRDHFLTYQDVIIAAKDSLA